MNSLVTGDFDWLASSGVMDLDIDSHGRITPGSFSPPGSSSGLKKLEFVDVDTEALGLSGLDISFDATPSHDGKIRVRIHPPSADLQQQQTSIEDDQSMWGGSEKSETDPFLGVGGEFGVAMDTVSVPQSASTFDFDYGVPQQQPQQLRRVRIALRTMPGEGREGGEWEVQLC